MEQNRIELFCFGKDVEEMTEQVEKASPEVAPWADSELLEALDQQAEANKQILFGLIRELLKFAYKRNLEAIGLTIYFFLCAFLVVEPLGQWMLSSDWAFNGLEKRQIDGFTSSEMEVFLFAWVYLFGCFLLFNLVIAWVKILPKARDSYRIYKARKY